MSKHTYLRIYSYTMYKNHSFFIFNILLNVSFQYFLTMKKKTFRRSLLQDATKIIIHNYCLFSQSSCFQPRSTNHCWMVEAESNWKQASSIQTKIHNWMIFSFSQYYASGERRHRSMIFKNASCWTLQFASSFKIFTRKWEALSRRVSLSNHLNLMLSGYRLLNFIFVCLKTASRSLTQDFS